MPKEACPYFALPFFGVNFYLKPVLASVGFFKGGGEANAPLFPLGYAPVPSF